jgi:hypothetical protein
MIFNLKSEKSDPKDPKRINDFWVKKIKRGDRFTPFFIPKYLIWNIYEQCSNHEHKLLLCCRLGIRIDY